MHRAWLLVCAPLGVAACDQIVGDSIDQSNAQQNQASGGAGGGAGGPPMMTAAEAQTFCEWYVNTAYPLAEVNGPPTFPPVKDGYAENYAAHFCYAGPWAAGACIMRPTVEHCVQNILNTWCEASIEALTDCVNGMTTDAQECPTPGSCDAFAAAPGCDETVVQPLHPVEVGIGGTSASGCKLRVE
jgi:hypothetical protein